MSVSERHISLQQTEGNTSFQPDVYERIAIFEKISAFPPKLDSVENLEEFVSLWELILDRDLSRGVIGGSLYLVRLPSSTINEIILRSRIMQIPDDSLDLQTVRMLARGLLNEDTFLSHEVNKTSVDISKRPLVCYNCGEPGHRLKNCGIPKQSRNRKKKSGEKIENANDNNVKKENWRSMDDSSFFNSSGGLKSSDFYFDMRIGRHIVNDRSLFEEFSKISEVEELNGILVAVEGKGTVKLERLNTTLNNALYVPTSMVNWVSILAAMKRGANFEFQKDVVKIYPEGRIVGHLKNNLFKVDTGF